MLGSRSYPKDREAVADLRLHIDIADAVPVAAYFFNWRSIGHLDCPESLLRQDSRRFRRSLRRILPTLMFQSSLPGERKRTADFQRLLHVRCPRVDALI